MPEQYCATCNADYPPHAPGCKAMTPSSAKDMRAMIEEKVDPREPDYSREGMFVYHNCYRCQHGKLPCVQGSQSRCDNPHARND